MPMGSLLHAQPMPISLGDKLPDREQGLPSGSARGLQIGMVALTQRLFSRAGSESAYGKAHKMVPCASTLPVPTTPYRTTPSLLHSLPTCPCG